MNHPRPEEWVPYLEGEASPEMRKQLAAHLEACPQCAAELDGWRRSMRRLEKLPFPRSRPARQWQAGLRVWGLPALRWGLAAGIVLLLGIWVGRSSAPSAVELKEAVLAQAREQARQEVQTDLLAALGSGAQPVSNEFQKQLQVGLTKALAGSVERLTAEKLRKLAEAVQAIQEQQEANRLDLLAVRNDLETAARAADLDLKQNSQWLAEVAAYLTKNGSENN